MSIFEDMYARHPDTKWYRKQQNVDYKLDVWMDTILNNYTAGTVIDLGCGAGYDSIRFVEREWKVNAYDIATTPIANLNMLYPIINAVVADVTKIDLPVAADVILDIGAMHCIEDASAHAAKIKKSLRPGGVLLLSHFSHMTRCPFIVYPKSIEALDELFSPMIRVAHNIIKNPAVGTGRADDIELDPVIRMCAAQTASVSSESHEVLYTNV